MALGPRAPRARMPRPLATMGSGPDEENPFHEGPGEFRNLCSAQPGARIPDGTAVYQSAGLVYLPARSGRWCARSGLSGGATNVPDAVAGAASKIAGMRTIGWVDGADGHTVAGILDRKA